MMLEGKRVSCWYCNGDLERHPDEKKELEEQDDCEAECYEHILRAMYRCKDCGATIRLTTTAEDQTDPDTPDSPYDNNRCPKCGGYAIWGSDFNYDEVYGEGEGIVSYLHCQRCGCELEYSVREDDPGDDV